MGNILALIYEFSKIGIFAIGGGLASLPFLYEIAEKYDWFDKAMLTDMVAIAESTPGPIGINMATYAGFQSEGIIGGIIASLAVIFPSFIIVMLVSKVLTKFKTNPTVQGAFYGLRPAVTAMIASACIGVAKIALFNVDLYETTKNVVDLINIQALVLCAVVWMLLVKFKKHPAFYIAGAAVVGILIKM